MDRSGAFQQVLSLEKQTDRMRRNPTDWPLVRAVAKIGSVAIGWLTSLGSLIGIALGVPQAEDLLEGILILISCACTGLFGAWCVVISMQIDTNPR